MVYNRKPLLKLMIWGYHYFWKHPCVKTIQVNSQIYWCRGRDAIDFLTISLFVRILQVALMLKLDKCISCQI